MSTHNRTTSPIRRSFKAFSVLTALFLLAGLILQVPVAQAASVVPVQLPGNPNCALLGFANEFKIDPPVSGTYSAGTFGSITLNNYGTSFDWSATFAMGAVIAKGGPNGANVYYYGPGTLGDTALSVPGGQYAISHVSFCYDDPADLVLTKSCEEYPSTSPRYRLSVYNLGPDAATQVTVVDTLPASIVLESPVWYSAKLLTAGGEVPAGSCTIEGGTVTCTLDSALSAKVGAYPMWVIDLYIDSGAEGAINVATVSAANVDPDTTNNTALGICLIPQAVDVVSFTAMGRESTIDLAWETATEIDNVGFNLLRAESPDGARTQINGEMIPAQALGSVSGASYTYVDSGVAAGVTYYYWLEDVAASGDRTLNGPVAARILAAASPEEGSPAYERPAGRPAERAQRGMPAFEAPVITSPVVVGPMEPMPMILTPDGPQPIPGPELQLRSEPVVPPPPGRGLPVQGGAR